MFRKNVKSLWINSPKGRIRKMTNDEYAYHFLGEGDDPRLSCNVFRVIFLMMRWFMESESPRELEELVNNLYYIRQKAHGRKYKKYAKN